MTTVVPGGAIGILGNGQLGRMLAMVAKRMGYRVHVFAPDADGPAGQVADREWVGAYEDEDLLAGFANAVDLVTVEFENIPAATREFLAERRPTRPSPAVVATTQHRGREKRFLAGHGLPVAPFGLAGTLAEASSTAARLGFPLIVKTAGFGYDGKGQRRVADDDDLKAAYLALGEGDVVLEAVIDFAAEAAVIVGRGEDGEMAAYDVILTQHRHHVLDVASAPAALPEAAGRRAGEIACEVVRSLGMVGVMCVELFVLPDGELLVNEVAPRPHNAGHLTIESAVTNQFEQQLRAICGLALGDATFTSPAAMANLLGELWSDGEPAWNRVAAMRDVSLHLYGKRQARAGRKMGHLTTRAPTAPEAEARVRGARASLAPVSSP